MQTCNPAWVQTPRNAAGTAVCKVSAAALSGGARNPRGTLLTLTLKMGLIGEVFVGGCSCTVGTRSDRLAMQMILQLALMPQQSGAKRPSQHALKWRVSDLG